MIQREAKTTTSAEAARCPACGAAGPFEGLYGLLSRCRNCSHAWWPPGLTRETAETLYDRDYFAGGEYCDYLHDRAAWEGNARRRLRWMARHCDGRKVLEVGCAYGFFGAVAAREFGYDYGGVDVAAEAVAYATGELGLAVTRGDAETCSLSDGPFDVICLWDVIEHLPFPERCLVRLSDALSPNGSLLLTTGDFGSLLARLQGRRWRQIHPPTHIHYFTRRSLGALLQRNHLEATHMSHVGATRNLKSVFAALAGLETSGGLKAAACRWLAQVVPSADVTIGLGDLLFVCARRSHQG